MPPKRVSPVWKRFQLLLGLFAISVLVLSAAFIHRANDHINYVEQKHSFKPPPNEAPPGVVTCLRDNAYEHMCMRLHKRNTSCGPPVKLTPPLKLLCIDKIRTLDTCLYPNIVHFNPPMDPIPLPELRALLAEAGGAECVAGPMSLTDVVRSRYTGPLGVPRWSIYRKSCIGKYRDYTPREMLSVLYHFTQRMAAEGTLNTGIIFSGDSLVRTVMHRLLCMLRDVAHCVSEVTDLLYIVRADRDEAVNIHDWRVRMVLDVEDQEKVHLPLPHRCILAKFFPGFLPVHPPASECEEHVKGVLLAFLGIWDPDPLTPVFELHKRMPPPPISYNCFTYWSPGGNFRNRKPERMIDVFQEFHEQRYAAFYGKTSLHGRYAERAGKSPIMFYATSPRLNMTKSERNMITRYIPTAVLEQRNTYLRHLPWTVSPNSSLPALKLDGQSPMQRYLLDFDVIWRVMSDIATRIDAAHFLCFPLEFEYSDGYFCPGLIDGIMVQWMGHIVGSELLA